MCRIEGCGQRAAEQIIIHSQGGALHRSQRKVVDCVCARALGRVADVLAESPIEDREEENVS
mgnify:CR=1 FL=1